MIYNTSEHLYNLLANQVESLNLNLYFIAADKPNEKYNTIYVSRLLLWGVKECGDEGEIQITVFHNQKPGVTQGRQEHIAWTTPDKEPQDRLHFKY